MSELSTNYQGPELLEGKTYSLLPSFLQDKLKKVNGFVAFEGGFHLRGVCDKPQWHSLHQVWRGEWALSELFEEVQKDDIPFAQDCMGDQFLLRGEEVYRLYAEAGEVESLNMTLKAFFTALENSHETILDLEVLEVVKESEDTLEPGELMVAHPPFVMQEADEGVQLEAMPCLEALEYYAELADNVKSLAKEEVVDD